MPPKRVQGMRSFFEPRSIAVAGVSADPDKMGSIIFANLMENRRSGILKASVYALNPAHKKIGGHPCYPTVGALPETPELLIIAVPGVQTLGVVRDAAEAGVKAAIVITSGYAEAGHEGVEKEIGVLATKHGMRILGPNTIGLLDTRSGVDSLFLRPTKKLPDGSQVESLLKPLVGGVTIVTQSGHLGEVISEELASAGVGIRALVGTGNQLDVSVEEVIEYFADDPATKVLAVYLEGLRDGRRFMRVAARAVKKKPIVVFKVGKTAVGARAALTHTASLVGDYDVYRAAFRQSGVVEAEDLQDLVDYSISLSMLPTPSGRRVAILTNAGGVGVIAADRAESLGLEVRRMGANEQGRLRSGFADAGVASNAALGNPVDVTASASTEEFVKVTGSVVGWRGCDLALVLPTHQTPAIGSDIADRLAGVVSKANKPVAMCVIGDSDFAGRIRREFMAKGIPCYPTPERAVRALAALWKHAELGRRARYPSMNEKRAPSLGLRAGPLGHDEVSRILEAYGVDEPRSVVVRSAEELGRARRLSFPVACKLLSTRLVHKTDAGGVVLNVGGPGEVEAALRHFREICSKRGFEFEGMLVQEMVKGGAEVILGGTRDPTFGPTIVFGLGGTLAELVRDYSLGVAPVTPEEGERIIKETRLAKALAGYRGGIRVDVRALSRVVSGFSRIVAENPAIEEAEVNPLIVRGARALAADARVVASARNLQG